MKKIVRSLRSPANSLVIETAQRNWWLIAVNLMTTLTSAVLEGSTLGIIYLAIACLTENEGSAKGVGSALLKRISSIFPWPPERLFLALICGAVLLQVCLSLSSYVNKVATAYLSAKAQSFVTGKVFERIMTFSYGCVSRYKVGDLVMFSNEAASAVDRQITEINNIVFSLSFALIYLAIIVRLSWLLAVAATILVLAIAVVQYRLIPRLRRVVKKVTETQVESAKFITENIQALRLLHTFGTQRQAVVAADVLLNKTRVQMEKRAVIMFIPEPILDSLPIIALAILAASAVLFQNSQTSILPLLLTFLLALQRLSARLKQLANAVTRFVDNSARMVRLETILNRQDKEFVQSGSEPFLRLSSDIKFQSIDLSYQNDELLALKNLSFVVPQNQVTALVGQSGAGKSSIVDLLLGLYQPQSGSVLVNNKPLSEYAMEDWRKHIGVVSQDTFIFNASILENLRYGRPEAKRDEVIESAKAAQAHEFILDLPDGYDTVVGERGYRLSGGQRQRLALARALVKQPEILILDEATSALDSESEKLIQQALEQFQKDRTVIVVAHRLSTIIGADQILVLDRGEVIEQGTHDSLLKQRQGRYARYWQLQSREVAA